MLFLDPEGKFLTTLVVRVLGISSLKIPKAFLIHSGVQQNSIHIHADIPHRSNLKH